MAKMERMNKKHLIYLVRANPGLYNKYDPLYQKKDEKQKVWEEISKQMNFPVNVCKMRWNNLRDCYRRAIIKNETTYKYSKELRFLIPYMNDKKIEPYEEHYDYENGSNSNEMMWNEPLPYVHNDDSSPIETKEQISQINSSCQQTLRESDSFQGDYSEDVNPLLWTDHVDSFLSGIAPVLKCLNRYNLCKAKAEIFQVVSKYELKTIQEESGTASQNSENKD